MDKFFSQFMGAVSGFIFACALFQVFHNCPPPVEIPTITGVGYEAIVGHRCKARVFKDGTEYDTVDEMLEVLGFTGNDLDQQVGGKALKLMKDWNALDEIK